MRKSRLIIILAAVAVVACAAVIFFVTRNGSGQETTGSSVGRPEMLPDYCRTEVSRVAREITAQSEEGDISPAAKLKSRKSERKTPCAPCATWQTLRRLTLSFRAATW